MRDEALYKIYSHQQQGLGQPCRVTHRKWAFHGILFTGNSNSWTIISPAARVPKSSVKVPLICRRMVQEDEGERATQEKEKKLQCSFQIHVHPPSSIHNLLLYSTIVINPNCQRNKKDNSRYTILVLYLIPHFKRKAHRNTINTTIQPWPTALGGSIRSTMEQTRQGVSAFC